MQTQAFWLSNIQLYRKAIYIHIYIYIAIHANKAQDVHVDNIGKYSS